ncbi:hypothetical protein HRR83_004405 [Exophiala dermatitidis]|uniref:Uncharacterized protein n=1 Tax=Exophiala dermatitidis TaxID=5970 RepID=A0AAN6IU28_EXODE|nr:hypothetical protein HRR73_006132 [Exophiala dermatitidis]KAJ4521290.1 hypothetical protein HRR74_003113 [Exophiala dermatitidis]KAJ4541957.1 hypothetical protein HRR77_005848 [Exophiala dermatitidis]KAJ4544722.1 hypothetical protein HRR76_002766 [Exophiala dermatitidis]KAJ4565198.1 hypothetical protein HRR79_005467 [Exophiala dermatitidis]
MIQLRGPLTPVGESRPQSDWVTFVQLSLVVYKSLGSFVTGQAPEVPSDSPAYTKEAFEELDLYKPLAYPQTPFSPELCMILSQLPPGLSELSLRSRISVQMIKLLASISAANTLADPDSAPQDAHVCPAARREHGRRQVMIQVILSSLQRMYLTTKTAIEYHLTSGLIAYMFQLRGMEPLSLFHDPLLRNFIQTMPRHAPNLSKEEQHCMIWASLAVAGALGLRVAPMPESHVVMDHILEMYLEAREWPRLEKILRDFCWKDEVGDHWKYVWERAMDRRQFLLQRRKNDHDLNGPLPPQGHALVSCESAADDAAPEVLPQQVHELTAGAPKSVREMAQAMRLCPFHSTAALGSSCPI